MDYYGYQVYNRNDIRHWKYIKRERVNGKWRYYYDDPEYRNALNSYNLAKSNTTTIALKRAANKVNYDAANRKVSRDWMRSRDGKNIFGGQLRNLWITIESGGKQEKNI